MKGFKVVTGNGENERKKVIELDLQMINTFSSGVGGKELKTRSLLPFDMSTVLTDYREFFAIY